MRSEQQERGGGLCRYDYSGSYGEHSRVFFYTQFFGWDYCYVEYYIGHTYNIFGSRVTWCSTWSYS